MDDAFWKFLTALLSTLITVAVPILLRYVMAKTNEIKDNLKKSKPELYVILDQVAKAVVLAAEEAKLAGLVEDKKKYAISLAEKWLEAEGVTIDLDILDAAIEAAVYEFFNSKPEERVAISASRSLSR